MIKRKPREPYAKYRGLVRAMLLHSKENKGRVYHPNFKRLSKGKLSWRVCSLFRTILHFGGLPSNLKNRKLIKF